MTGDPATQLREHIIRYLDFNQPEMPLLEGKVRKLWDVSGDLPQGDTGIVVSCEDLGGHNGMPGRELVDVRVNIRIFTNLDEDDTGVLLDNLESETMRLLAAMPDPDRSAVVAVQTPQIFRSEDIKAAYAQAYDQSFTDDASVAARIGIPPAFEEGERFNLKITTPEDLVLAEAILSIRKE